MDSKIAIKQKSFFEIKKDMLNLLSNYPFINLKVLSRSTLGREIYAAYLGKGEEYIYYLPSFCGNQTLNSIIILRFLEEVCFALQTGGEIAGVNIRKATCGKGIIFVPLINPDGHEIAVKGFSAASYLCNTISKNADTISENFEYNLRGVYLENNFYKTNATAPYKNRFGGFAPFSEPESLALAETLRKFVPRHILNFNETQENISFYNLKNDERPLKMAEIINAIYPQKQTEETSANTFGAWVKNEFSAPTFTVGLKGISEENLIEYYNKIKELLVLMLIM